jgi:hypothetical protein
MQMSGLCRACADDLRHRPKGDAVRLRVGAIQSTRHCPIEGAGEGCDSKKELLMPAGRPPAPAAATQAGCAWSFAFGGELNHDEALCVQPSFKVISALG